MTANVEKAYTEDGHLIVITRRCDSCNLWIDNFESRIDKRVVEYAQSGTHSYREWDNLLKPLGYPSIWEMDFEITEKNIEIFRENLNYRREQSLYWTKEDAEKRIKETIAYAKRFYEDPVEGIEFHYIPKGKMFKIVCKELTDEHGEFDGYEEVVDIFEPDEYYLVE